MEVILITGITGRHLYYPLPLASQLVSQRFG
ncbi:hypothetical protein TSOC111612_08635 [Tsukamurella ocularis]